jgi:hypothetical protein
MNNINKKILSFVLIILSMAKGMANAIEEVDHAPPSSQESSLGQDGQKLVWILNWRLPALFAIGSVIYAFYRPIKNLLVIYFQNSKKVQRKYLLILKQQRLFFQIFCRFLYLQ